MWLLGSQALHSTSVEARTTNTFLLFTYASHVSGRLLQDFWMKVGDGLGFGTGIV